MAGRFEGSIVIEKPIGKLFAFLANGENDKLFSSRIVEIHKTSRGPIGVGSSWASKVNDGGVKSDREFQLTEFDQPSKIRWTEISKNRLAIPEGGYDLKAIDRGKTELTLFNVLDGNGFVGGMVEKIALRQAHKSVDKMLEDIKEVAEDKA